MARAISFGLFALAFVAMWVEAGILYPHLPARFPAHFDIHGAPDRWDPTTAFNWFLMPAIGTALAFLLAGIAAALPVLFHRWPSIVNIPRKAQFMALPPQGRERVVTEVSVMLALTGAVMLGLFCQILYATAQVAQGARATAPLWPALAAIGVILVIVFIGQFRIGQRITIESAIAYRE